MESIRTFIALEIPASIQQGLKSLVDCSRRNIPEGIRWVPSFNIHLTMKFLGEVQISRIPILEEGMASLLSPYPLMVLQFTNLDVFPNSRNPRVVWYGVKLDPKLAQMAGEIEKLARDMQFPSEDRPFSPHLTLGRVNPHQTDDFIQHLHKWLVSASGLEIRNALCDWVTIFKSDLTVTGAHYTPVHRFHLSGTMGEYDKIQQNQPRGAN